MDNVASAFAAPPTAKAIRFEADTGAAVVLIVDGWQGFAVVSYGSGNLAAQTVTATVDRSSIKNPTARFAPSFEAHGGVTITAAQGDGCLLVRRIEQGRKVRVSVGAWKVREVRTADGRLLFGPG